MEREIDNVRKRYAKRSASNIVYKHQENWVFNHFIQSEREFIYNYILRKYIEKKIDNIKIIEIGAGAGGNLLFFHRLGIPFFNIYANELLESRGILLKANLPNSLVHIGDACELEYKETFDIVFQSTVFTSILDGLFKKKIAKKMWEMTKQDGIVLWYDFKYNNPNNKDVKGIGKKEIKELFPLAKAIDFYSVTLAPPIGRRVGKFYNIINFFFPFLRTHLIAVIKK